MYIYIYIYIYIVVQNSRDPCGLSEVETHKTEITKNTINDKWLRTFVSTSKSRS